MKTRLFFGLFVLFVLAGAWVVLPGKTVSAEPASSKLSSPVRVSAGFAHTCVLDSSGSISCWGENQYGQNDVPAPNAGFIEVSAGWYHTCALRGNGSAACWGSNNRGQATVPALPAERHFTAVSAGGYHSCGLVDDGSIICWGENSLGQRNLPEPYTGFTAVSAGWYHTCALKEEGTPICWGFNYWGQATPALGLYKQISAGGYMSCGLTTAGEIRCWGNTVPGDSYGEVTNAPTTGDWTQVDSGMQHSCALRTDGSSTCWGWDSNHQVSDRPEDNLNLSVSAGYEHTCAVRSSPDGYNTLACWGSNVSGQAPIPWINQVGLPAASYMTGYSATLTGSGGSEGPYTFSIAAGRLPAGLQLSPDGVISGWPTELGRFIIMVQILDTNRISGASQQEIQVGAVGTTTTVGSNANPAVVGQPVKFTATVQPVTGLGIPSGEISFYDGPNELARRMLVQGQASFQTTYSTVGNHSIIVQYHGHHAGGFTASVSDPLEQQVNKAGTTLTVTANWSTKPAAPVYGQPVTLTATVSAAAAGAGTPSGSIVFTVGGEENAAGLSGGTATFTLTDLPVGSITVSAAYAGDDNFNGASGALAGGLEVGKAGTSVSLTSSKNPAAFGEAVGFTATVSVMAPGSGTPEGTLEFYNGSDLIGSGALVAGQHAVTISTLALDGSPHAIRAVYTGSGSYHGSNSTDLSQQIGDADLAAQIRADSSEVLPGGGFTYTLTVENHGILTAADVIATVTLPPQVIQTDMPAGCAAAENVLTCALPDLAARGQESLALPVRVPEQTPGGTQLVIRGGVQSAVYDRNAANNSVEELRVRVLAPPINYYLPLIFVW